MGLCFYAAYQGSTSLSACSDEITVIQYNNICLSAQLYRNLIFARCLFMHRCLFKFVNTMTKSTYTCTCYCYQLGLPCFLGICWAGKRSIVFRPYQVKSFYLSLISLKTRFVKIPRAPRALNIHKNRIAGSVIWIEISHTWPISYVYIMA